MDPAIELLPVIPLLLLIPAGLDGEAGSFATPPLPFGEAPVAGLEGNAGSARTSQGRPDPVSSTPHAPGSVAYPV